MSKLQFSFRILLFQLNFQHLCKMTFT